MKVYDNAAGVLTNNPPFDCQMSNLANYMSLSAARPANNFGDYGAEEYGAGLGAFGLQGTIRLCRASCGRRSCAPT